MLRLAGHDFMDFDNSVGGSDGCVNFEDPDNMGLAQCVSASDIIKVYDEFCGSISLADFVVIAAEAITARTSSTWPEKHE